MIAIERYITHDFAKENGQAIMPSHCSSPKLPKIELNGCYRPFPALLFDKLTAAVLR
jgi:hypothetical protein